MISQDIIASLHGSVCALGVRLVDQEQHMREPTAPHFQIIGTGFAIDDDLVLTNRHVLEAMRRHIESNGYDHDDLTAQFITPKGDGWSLHFCRFGGVGLCTTPEEDVGLIQLPGLRELGSRAVKLGAPAELKIGQPLGLLGYADGERLQQANQGAVLNEELYRFGPILQQGYLSAVAPMHGCGVTNRLLLDIRTTGGLSGSPVFSLETGEVFGVHFASNKTTTAFAVPLDASRVTAYRKNFDESLAKWASSSVRLSQ